MNQCNKNLDSQIKDQNVLSEQTSDNMQDYFMCQKLLKYILFGVIFLIIISFKK